MKAGACGVAAGILATAFVLGCSGAKEPPPDGNLQMRVFAGQEDPTVCKIAHNMQIAKKGGSPPSHEVNQPGGRVEDGSEGFSVSCSIHGKDQFSITGSINGSAAAFSFSGNVAKGGSGQGSIAQYSSQFQATVASPADAPCTFYVDKDPLQVAPGRIWARFECPKILDTSLPTTTTCAASGEFIFENCSE
ncbi:MAG: hypothetical protein OZ921_11190 [Sorangiineae bacterium]|nr:hypothetical protein [Polyangiaceae bacterium]MEB2323070.1 hypothetical protein [Sorangiineae bacterium]